MKTFKLICLSIITLFTINFTKAQNLKVCCPDTSSLISGSGDFANSNLVIEKPVIAKIAATGHYSFTALVTDSGDDCSYCTKIIVLLPAEVNVLRYSAVSTHGRTFMVTRCFGSLEIDAGMMCPGMEETKTYVHQIKITVETSNHTKNVHDAGFAIFAYSKIPDLKQENNYWYGRK